MARQDTMTAADAAEPATGGAARRRRTGCAVSGPPG